jgi:photosystem II stability/assembly factor-like uncharacterized protein
LLLWLSGTALAADGENRLPVQYRDKPFALTFASEADIWIVGDFGLMLHSPDGGGSWERIDAGTTRALYDVSFADAEHGWVVGASGTILATADGGQTWTVQESGTTEDLLAVQFLDASHGFAAGLFATALATTDGGATWEDIMLVEGSVAEADWEQLETQVFESPLLNDVFFIDDRTGWIAGEYGVVFATEDGGETWDRQRTGEQAILFSVAFVDRHKGWVVGLNGLILQTMDGGKTWTPQESPSPEGLYQLVIRNGNGIIVGDAGTLLRTNDGGESWSLDGDVGVFGWLRGVASPDGQNFMVVGAHGAVLTSSDAGATWKRIP